ncbi:hypothetical protein [Cystobacter ferrugineus]|nr:hypothetical protein [Cystobacter ferrugineus]
MNAENQTQTLEFLQKLMEQTEMLEAPVVTQGSAQERDWLPPHAQFE